jgi:hypothetical protein
VVISPPQGQEAKVPEAESSQASEVITPIAQDEEVHRMLKDKKLIQIAYYAPDIEEAAARHSALFGSGPFFVMEHVPIRTCTYRGKPTPFDHSTAVGQWGDIMVEFLTVHSPAPNLKTDISPRPDSAGVHHQAFLVDDPASLAKAAGEQGFELAMHAIAENGIEVFFIDTVGLYGHFIELYAPSAPIRELYGFVREQSVGFNGQNPVRAF